MKLWGWIIGLLALVLVVAAGSFYWQNLRGVWPAIRPPSDSITQPLTGTSVPIVGGLLTVPNGFSIEVFARDVRGARALVRDTFGNYWVSQTGPGIISQVEVDRDTGQVRAINPVFRNLRNPHGLALDPEFPTMLYFAEEHRIARVPLYSDGSIEPILDLPAGGGHATRTLGFGPDGRLYVSIGSSCNVCKEKDPRRSTILSLNRDGTDVKTVATGLRNAVFFTWNPRDGKLWATENSRDLLGDNVPPDELNVIEAGKDYGWPFCYGAKALDAAFDTSTAAQEHCARSEPATVEIQAHSAPLGITVIPQEGWPAEYAGDMIVAYHGSWNRTQPTGYKLVRVKLDDQGNFEGLEDFITGWLKEDETTLGRPVGVYAEPGGVLYITDDKADVIYKMTYGQR